MPALGFTSSPSEATPSSLPTQSTGRSPGLLIDMAILIAAILSFLSFLVYYNFKGSSGISSIFHTRICNGTKREGNDIEKCSQTDRIRKDIISQPNLLYGTGSLVLNDPDIGSSVIVTDMQESDLSLNNVQETSEGPKVSWTVYRLSSHKCNPSLIYRIPMFVMLARNNRKLKMKRINRKTRNYKIPSMKRSQIRVGLVCLFHDSI